MKLEDQVPDIALCKRLKELGFPQEDSFFYWGHGWKVPGLFYGPPYTDFESGVLFYHGLAERDDISEQEIIAAAPTVAELGEILPVMVVVDGKEYNLVIDKLGESGGNDFVVSYYSDQDLSAFTGYSGKMSDGFASMWIYLREENLIPAPGGIE